MNAAENLRERYKAIALQMLTARDLALDGYPFEEILSAAPLVEPALLREFHNLLTGETL